MPGYSNLAGLLRRRLTLFAALAAVLVLVAPVATQGPRAPVGPVLVDGLPAAAGEVLVKYRAGTRDDERRLLIQQMDADEDHDVGGVGVRRVHSRVFDTETLVSFLRTHPRVLYAEPNYLVHADATAPDDPLFLNLWGLKNAAQAIGCGLSCYGSAIGTAGADISATSAWDISTGSRANVVAVIDTGIDYTHPDLAANVWSAPSAFSVTIGGQTITCAAGTHGLKSLNNSLSCDPLDDHNHGSHVSGIIGAVGNNGVGVAGVNWTASIMGAKFLDSTGRGYVSDAINAIEFAIQAKSVFGAGANVRVLSNSWGGDGFSQALLDEITRANANDMLFVAAAGNGASNNDQTPYYPASYAAPNVIAVAATTNQDALASFSNYGPATVHLGAPGQAVLSTIRGGYAYLSGTSMAAPHVSGAAALLLSACALDTGALKTTLLANVDQTLVGWVSSSGRLNVDQAIRACSGAPLPADFAVAAAPASRSVVQGAGTSYTVTVTPSNGFDGSVDLSASGVPIGASATFAPTSIPSGSSTLAVTTSSSTPAGTYALTITGRGPGGTPSHSMAVTLSVTAAQVPDFTLSASPASRSMKRGQSTTYTVSIARSGGFTGGVALSLSGLAKGATASFDPNPAAATSSTLTITTTGNAAAGTFSLMITGTGGGLTRTAPVSLTVARK